MRDSCAAGVRGLPHALPRDAAASAFAMPSHATAGNCLCSLAASQVPRPMPGASSRRQLRSASAVSASCAFFVQKDVLSSAAQRCWQLRADLMLDEQLLHIQDWSGRPCLATQQPTSMHSTWAASAVQRAGVHGRPCCQADLDTAPDLWQPAQPGAPCASSVRHRPAACRSMLPPHSTTPTRCSCPHAGCSLNVEYSTAARPTAPLGSTTSCAAQRLCCSSQSRGWRRVEKDRAVCCRT